MEQEEIVIKEYDKDDDVEIISFFESAYPKGWRSKENWDWLFHKNPYKKNILIIARNRDNNIVSAMHSMPLYIKFGNGIFFSYYGTDGAVHKNYRGKGLFNIMVKKKDELLYNTGAKLQYTHTSNPILVKQYSRDRLKFPFNAKYFTYIDNVNLHLKNEQRKNTIIIKYVIIILKNFNKLLNFSNVNSLNNVSIKTICKFSNDYNVLWSEISEHYDLIIKKDSTYLNWRYMGKSGNNYIVREARIEDKLIGFTVLKIDYGNPKYPFGHIIDLLIHPKYNNNTSLLIKDAVNYMKISGVNIIESLVIKKQIHEKHYKSNGFIETDKQSHIYLLHKGLEKEFNIIQSSSIEKKHFSKGDLFIN